MTSAISYFNKIQYLYPNIQQVSYWFTQSDGTPWTDLYEGIVWDNKEVPKPTKETLDALDDEVVEQELAERAEEARKAARDSQSKSNLGLVAAYNSAKVSSPTLTWTAFLYSLEESANQID